MNGWGQFFLGALALATIAGAHRRWLRYRLSKKMIDADYSSEDIVDVMESINRGNLDRYIDGDDRGFNG